MSSQNSQNNSPNISSSAKSSSKNRSFFKVDQNVVCASNGLGVVKGIVEKDVPNSGVQEFFRIFFEKDNLTSYVPVEKIAELGIRKTCTKDIANKVFTVLSAPPKSARGMWSKKAQEYEAKVFSGSILFAAEVLRDLWPRSKDPSRSYSEGVICDSALSRVAGELSVVLGLSKEETMDRINAALVKSSGHLVKIEQKHKDDFDDILDDFEDGKNDKGEGADDD